MRQKSQDSSASFGMTKWKHLKGDKEKGKNVKQTFDKYQKMV
jgi:hypothetical protein